VEVLGILAGSTIVPALGTGDPESENPFIC
jgi:hypothetical protein